MLSYILLSIVLPASVIFVFSTVNSTLLTAPFSPSYFLLSQIVLALFGRSLGVRRLYVRVLLGIFQVHIELGSWKHLFFPIFIHMLLVRIIITFIGSMHGEWLDSTPTSTNAASPSEARARRPKRKVGF